MPHPIPAIRAGPRAGRIAGSSPAASGGAASRGADGRNGRRRVRRPWAGKAGLFAFWMLAAIHSSPAAPADDALERARSLTADGRYPEARTALDPLLARRAGDPRARLLDGILRAREGRPGEAIEVFERLRRDRPEMSEPWSNLAVLYAAEGRFDEAREALLAALERRPSAAGFPSLGDLYGKLARRASPRTGERAAAPESDRAPPAGRRDGAPPSLPRGEPGRSATADASAKPDGDPPAAGAGDPLGDPPAARGGCLRAGGFEDRRVLAEVEEWLGAHGAEVFELRRVRERVGSRRVYLPPLGSRAEAAAKLGEVRARGVRDVAIIESGPLENGISFGVFGSAENARRRVEALQRLGYRVRRRDEGRTVHAYYLEARAGGDPDGLLAAWTERFPGPPLVRVDCR